MRTQNDGKKWPKTKFEFAFSWTHQQYLGAACKLSWGALLLNYYMSQQCDCYVILCSIQAKQCWIPFPLLPHIYINLILCLSFKNIFHFYCRLMIVANFSLRPSTKPSIEPVIITPYLQRCYHPQGYAIFVLSFSLSRHQNGGFSWMHM